MDKMSELVEETDVLVVGGGGSGITAAIFARKNGAKVMLLEKYHELRGSTGLSIGSITATGTTLQRKAGIDDNADDHFEDMGKFASQFRGDSAKDDNLELRRVLVDNVAESVEWLRSLGVTFYGPMPEPPHRQPRMHNILPNSRAYIYFVGREARRLGVEVREDASVERLVLEGNKVIGAIAKINGREVEIRTRRAVILATGDYSSSPEWKSRFHNVAGDIDGVNTTNVGDGQRFGEELGAEVKYGSVMYGPNLRFMPPPKPKLVSYLPPYTWFTKLMRLSMKILPGWVLRPFILQFVTTYLSPEPSLFEQGAILINKNGDRFVDELDQPNNHFGTQPDKIAYFLFDSKVAKKFRKWPYFISTAPGVAYAYLDDYRRTRPDLFHKSNNLDGIANSLDIAPDQLNATVAEYNDSSSRKDRPRISNGPYYALGPVKSWIILTDGGLTVNRNHQVITKEGAVVPGLYAVGSAGQGGLLLEGHGHHLGWAFTSGRLAGAHAATAGAEAVYEPA